MYSNHYFITVGPEKEIGDVMRYHTYTQPPFMSLKYIVDICMYIPVCKTYDDFREGC